MQPSESSTNQHVDNNNTGEESVQVRGETEGKDKNVIGKRTPIDKKTTGAAAKRNGKGKEEPEIEEPTVQPTKVEIYNQQQAEEKEQRRKAEEKKQAKLELKQAKENLYPKDDQRLNAIAKLESRGVPQDIQEKLGLRWVSQREAQSEFYNFKGVSPWGCILIPYTLDPNIKKFYGQCYNFYPTKEIENKERQAIEAKFKKDKKSKFRKYLSPYLSNRTEYPFYDPAILLDSNFNESKVLMITEDTFGVIRAAMLGQRCWSSRIGVILISREEIENKKTGSVVGKLIKDLGYTVPWFPDNDWVKNPNVWTETIKSAVHLGLSVGIFKLCDEKIGLDEYIENDFNILELKDNVHSLEEFLTIYTKKCTFKVKRNSISISTLCKHFSIDFAHLVDRFSDIKNIVIDLTKSIDSQLGMETTLNTIFTGKIRLNELENDLEFPEFPNADMQCLPSWLSEDFGVTFSSSCGVPKLQNHLLYLAKKDAYHPFEDYLLACADKYKDTKVEELGNLTELYFGSSDPLHNQIVLKCLFYAAIARIFEPGCFIKPILVLAGQQSAGKTSFLRALLPNARWCVSDMTDPESKDAKMLCQKSVIMEWGEISRIINAHRLETAKNWLTRTEDHYRPPYGYSVEAHPRRFITVGTTNDREILTCKHDHTRFKIVALDPSWKIPLKRVPEDRDRIWGTLTNWWLSLSVDERETALRFSELDDAASLAAAENHRIVDIQESQVLEACEGYAFVETAALSRMGLICENTDRATQMRLSSILKSAGWVNDRPTTCTKRRLSGFRNPSVAEKFKDKWFFLRNVGESGDHASESSGTLTESDNP